MSRQSPSTPEEMEWQRRLAELDPATIKRIRRLAMAGRAAPTQSDAALVAALATAMLGPLRRFLVWYGGLTVVLGIAVLLLLSGNAGMWIAWISGAVVTVLLLILYRRLRTARERNLRSLAGDLSEHG